MPQEPAIALNGDYVFVGSQLEEGQAGKVYVFKRTGGLWTLHQILRATPHLTFQRFGEAIDTDGELLLIGAPRESNAGAVFVFELLENGFWDQREILRPADPVVGIRLGSHLQADQVTLAVGAPAVNLNRGGQVHLFGLERHIGTQYGAAAPNSTGEPAKLAGFGNALIQHNCLTLKATDLPPMQFGYFLMSAAQGYVPLFGGSQGNLLLSLPFFRFSRDVLVSDLAGEASFALDLAALPQGIALQPGETWNFQMWFRDTNPGSTSNTTNGLAVTFATDAAPAIQFPVTLLQTTENAQQFDVAVTLSQAASYDIAVPYTTSGTANYNVDWRVEELNPFVVPAGETSFEMTIVVAEDADLEGDETAIVTLGNPAGGVLGTAPHFTLTILDDD
ncbi:MAG: hypothetical protein GY725_19965 [bacterium]|nr:hypothetical protein [bacterium]